MQDFDSAIESIRNHFNLGIRESLMNFISFHLSRQSTTCQMKGKKHNVKYMFQSYVELAEFVDVPCMLQDLDFPSADECSFLRLAFNLLMSPSSPRA